MRVCCVTSWRLDYRCLRQWSGVCSACQGTVALPRVRSSGVVRFLIEIIFFGFATWGLFESGATTAGWIFGGLSLFHYIISYDRVIWLLKQ